MTCRHSDPVNNPQCSSYRSPEQQVSDQKELLDRLQKKFGTTDTPDSERFEIEDFYEEDGYLVLMATYPNCKNCNYEGKKVMVFKDVTVRDVLKWKKIDPHFGDQNDKRSAREAPSPIARFPGWQPGWVDAIEFVPTTTLE